MRKLISDYSDLTSSRFRAILTIPQQPEIVGSNTYTSDLPDTRLSGLKAGEEVLGKKNGNKNVIFFHFGFFTIRMVPRKSQNRLMQLFL